MISEQETWTALIVPTGRTRRRIEASPSPAGVLRAINGRTVSTISREARRPRARLTSQHLRSCQTAQKELRFAPDNRRHRRSDHRHFGPPLFRNSGERSADKSNQVYCYSSLRKAAMSHINTHNRNKQQNIK